MMRYWLIDSNVLVSAFNEIEEQHRHSKALLELAATGRFDGCIAHQNILEVIATVTSIKRVEKPVSIELALKVINQYTSFLKVITPKDETLWDFLSLLRDFSAIRERIFDLYLAATALSNGISQICTWNIKHLDKIPQLRVRTPKQVIKSI